MSFSATQEHLQQHSLGCVVGMARCGHFVAIEFSDSPNLEQKATVAEGQKQQRHDRTDDHP